MMLNHYWSFMTLVNDLFDDAQPLLVVHDLDEHLFDDIQPLLVVHNLDERLF
jgi:hypothetical protein